MLGELTGHVVQTIGTSMELQHKKKTKNEEEEKTYRTRKIERKKKQGINEGEEEGTRVWVEKQKTFRVIAPFKGSLLQPLPYLFYTLFSRSSREACKR